jgi:hypothetical protein
MSDVSTAAAPSAPAPAAPAPSAPAPSAPAPSEAAVNESAVSLPNPSGTQPSAPSREEARREAIARAFERAGDTAVKPERVRPGMGHNNPPEPMQKERAPAKPEAKPEAKAQPKPQPKLDLKKRPSEQEQPTQPPPPRERGEHGHFTPKDKSPPAAPATGYAAINQPLPRMSKEAQRDWATTPESVRRDVHRMHHEFGKFYQQARATQQAVAPLAPYLQMAQQHGTTLDRALANYTGMEAKLRADPIAGLDMIVANLNLRTPDGRRIDLRDIAWHILNQTPDQHRALQQQNAQTAQSRQIGQLHQIVNTLAQNMQQMHYERQLIGKRGEVDRFAETHPRLDELGDIIHQELRLGFDLPTAYKRAELLRPATAAQTRPNQQTTAQTRSSPDRSISGAPDSSGNGTGRRHRPSASPREAAANAIKRMNGAAGL